MALRVIQVIHVLTIAHRDAHPLPTSQGINFVLPLLVCSIRLCTMEHSALNAQAFREAACAFCVAAGPFV